MSQESFTESTSARPISPAANAALQSNLSLIHKVVSTVRMPKEFREDAFQEAALAFLEHYEDYDASRAALSTFMWPHLRGAVTHLLRSEDRFPATTDRDEVLETGLLGAPKRGGAPMGGASAPQIVDLDVMRALLGFDLPDRELLYVLYWQDLSLSDLARLKGVSRQTLHVRHKRLIADARSRISPVALAA